jgi:hypothetical protein
MIFSKSHFIVGFLSAQAHSGYSHLAVSGLRELYRSRLISHEVSIALKEVVNNCRKLLKVVKSMEAAKPGVLGLKERQTPPGRANNAYGGPSSQTYAS